MNIKLLLTLSYLLLSSLFMNGQNAISPLSTKEKLADFDYFYQELKASYPYFNINKRVNGIDWLANKSAYQNRIKATTNDKEYIVVMQDILNDLNNGHTDFYPTIEYDYFYNAYKTMSQGDYPELKLYVTEMERFDAKNKSSYWSTIFREIYRERQGKETDNEETIPTSETPAPANLSCVYQENTKTAILSIQSFSYEFVEQDSVQLAAFYKTVHQYKNLIINIQGNGGGDDGYWKRIVANLIAEDIEFPVILAFKNSERIQELKPSYAENAKYTDLTLPNLPEELKSDDYLLSIDTAIINPMEGAEKFSGKIYLLVDEVVYSSAETLAYFCKATNFATVAGQTTSGDGIGSDPLLLTLPKSGIVCRFTGEMALNPDGSANEEAKTVPDVYLEGETTEVRLRELLDRIRRN